jgi:hypothetical protein
MSYICSGGSAAVPIELRANRKSQVVGTRRNRKGAVVYDLNGLGSEDWQRFSYRKGPFFRK